MRRWCVGCSVMSDSLWPMDSSLPDSSVHGILQERILEWVAIPFSRGSSSPRGQTPVPCNGDRSVTLLATRAAQEDDVSWTYCGHNFTVHVHPAITRYTSDLHRDVCQFFLSASKEKVKEEWMWTWKPIGSNQHVSLWYQTKIKWWKSKLVVWPELLTWSCYLCIEVILLGLPRSPVV